jgi:hypothetical protein
MRPGGADCADLPVLSSSPVQSIKDLGKDEIGRSGAGQVIKENDDTAGLACQYLQTRGSDGMIERPFCFGQGIRTGSGRSDFPAIEDIPIPGDLEFNLLTPGKDAGLHSFSFLKIISTITIIIGSMSFVDKAKSNIPCVSSLTFR